jgi:hypothetical protein
MFKLSAKKSKENKDWHDIGLEVGKYHQFTVSELTKYITTEGGLHRDKSGDLLVLNAALIYIVLDRQVFGLANEAERREFNDGLLFDVVTSLSNAFSPPANWQSMASQVNKKIELLSPYSQALFPGKDGNPKGTLYWEYIRILDKQYGVGMAEGMGVYSTLAQDVNSLWKTVEPIIGK